MVPCFLGLGSNLGDRLAHLRQAFCALRNSPEISEVTPSPVYETAPVGYRDQPSFLNMVVSLSTTLEPEALLAVALDIERHLGRERTFRWGPRVIDLDVLWYGGREVRTPRLTVPHSRLLERAFVLVPLADLAPDLPLEPGRTARELAAPTPDMRRVVTAEEFLRELPEVSG